MRYFFSTGEASGELSATLLAEEIAKRDRDASFEGIGARRMRDFGFNLWACNRGWSSITPVSVVPKVPSLFFALWRTTARLLREPPGRLVLIDFGAFNLRLATALRRRGYGGRIIYYFPPGAWFDKSNQACVVAKTTAPVPAFRHQYEFYRRLGLDARYFGHPLASRYQTREMRAAPRRDGGTVALLPGSRAAELRQHIPLLLDSLKRLRRLRPNVKATAVAADDRAEELLRRTIRAEDAIEIVRGTKAALENADAAYVASGTAVLEAALLGVPSAVFYRMSGVAIWLARRSYRGRYFALPNLIAGREIVPEFLQEDARPEVLAAAIDSILSDPLAQYTALREVRKDIGPSDALQRTADFVVSG
jgi:lipid-A-disaccharide synthase